MFVPDKTLEKYQFGEHLEYFVENLGENVQNVVNVESLCGKCEKL